MANGLMMILVAIDFLAFSGMLIVSPRQDLSYIADETKEPSKFFSEEMEKSARNPPSPVNQFSDSELSRFVVEHEAVAVIELVLHFEDAKEIINRLALTDSQVARFRENRIGFEANVAQFEDAIEANAATTSSKSDRDKFYREALDKLRTSADDFLESAESEILFPQQRERFLRLVKHHVLLNLPAHIAGRATWPRTLGAYLGLNSLEIAELSEVFASIEKELSADRVNARNKAVAYAVNVLPENKRALVADLANGDIEWLAQFLEIGSGSKSERQNRQDDTVAGVQLADLELYELVESKVRALQVSWTLALDSSELLIKQLDISEGQLDQLKKAKAEFSDKVAKLRSELEKQRASTIVSSKLEVFKAEYLADLQNLSEEYLAAVGQDILLRHQRATFELDSRRNLVNQLQSLKGKASWDRILAVYLKLTSKEIEQLTDSVDQVWKAVQKFDQEAQEKAVKQIAAVLPRKKRLYLEELAMGNFGTMARLLNIVED